MNETLKLPKYEQSYILSCTELNYVVCDFVFYRGLRLICLDIKLQ